MLRSALAGDCWSLYIGDEPAVFHSPDAPFVTAVRYERSYVSRRGAVKPYTAEAERVPLTGAASAGEGIVTFSGGGHSVHAAFSECAGGAKLAFSGEDGWSYEFRLPALAGEAVFGGGERRRGVNLRGETVVNCYSAGGEDAVLREKALLPRALYREKDREEFASRAPAPVFVTDRGRLILFGTDAEGFAYFGEKDYLFGYDRCPEGLTLLRGGSYRELARLLAERVENRQYLPDWCYDGMIAGVRGGAEAVLERTLAMLDAGAKICGVLCQDWQDKTLYPDLSGLIKKLDACGVRFLARIDACVPKDGAIYEYCRERGWLAAKRDGSVYPVRTADGEAGLLDLTHPGAARYVRDVLIGKNLLGQGVSGWLAECGGEPPVDCVLYDGDAHALHNAWPLLWARLNREAVDACGRGDVVFFTRGGGFGVQEYAPVVCVGERHTDDTRDYGLPSVVPAVVSLGFSGVTLAHCDIGGAVSRGRLRRDEELFVRWMELGAFSPLMRAHESTRPEANAQFDAERVKAHTARLTNVHAALKPYLEQCVREARAGVPAIRPDFYEATDYGAGHDEYSYFLGGDLYVCPVLRRRAEKRRVFLPKGVWVHFWTGKVYAGGEARDVPAPLGEIPVFYRAGSAFAELFRDTAKAFARRAENG